MVNKEQHINKEVQDFNSLQKSTHYRVTWEILQKIKSVRTTLIACVTCVLATYLLTGFVAYKYGLSLFSGDSIVGLQAEIKSMAKSWNYKNKHNKHIAKKYQENRSEREMGLRNQIEKLNFEIETIEKEKLFLASELKKSQDLCNEHSITIANLKSHDLAHRMFHEAYQTIAMNAVPLNLQQYLSLASDEQWIGYAQMASKRNAYNVIATIRSIPRLMKIKRVATIVNNFPMDVAESVEGKCLIEL